MAFLTSPIGNMVWIWQTPACAGGDIDAIIACARQNNVTTVAIKAFDGEWRYDRPTQFSSQIVQQLHNAGLSVAGWWYSVGDWQGPVVGDTSGQNIHDCTIEKELDNIAWTIAQGVDFLIIDPEKEWCSVPGQRDDPAGHATRYGEGYRQRFGNFPVYAGMVPSVGGYWVGNPLEQLMAWCDGSCPQVYAWSWGVDPNAWTDKAIRLSYGKPCFPIYESSSGATVDYMAAAAAYANQVGCKGVSWWSWQHCSDVEWEGVRRAGAMFGQLAALALQQPAPVPDEASPRLNLPANDSDNPAAWHCTTTDKWVVERAFLEFYLALGDRALGLLGLPVSGQDGKAQYFERARMELQDDGTVQLGRVGAELAEKLGIPGVS